MSLRAKGAAILLVILAASPVLAEPPFDGTLWLSPDTITTADPSGLTGVTYTGRGHRTIWDYRVLDWITVNAYLFEVRIRGRRIEFQVNPEFGSVDAARAEVDTYAPALGRLPAVLLSRAEKVHVNAGDPAHPDSVRRGRLHRRVKNVFGGNYFDRSITIHTGFGQRILRDGFLEEALFHEGAHVSLDNHQDAPGWRAAQEADGEFISDYARDFPDREDVAESVLLYFAMRYRPDRLSAGQRAAIADTIPTRLQYFDDLALDWSPYLQAVPGTGDDDGTGENDGDATGTTLPPAAPGRTTPPTLDLTCHGYDEGATRAYNCIPEPSQQHHMGTFVPAVGSACDGGSIAEFPAGRIVFQIRCRDGSDGQSAAWSYSGQGRESFVTPVDTPRVWLRTSFSGSSVHLSVWCRGPQENLVVNELLGTSWGNDGTNGIYGMAGCREVEVDTAGEDLQWWFAQELAGTALTPPRSWERVTGADSALPAEALQDLATAAELERRWRQPDRWGMNLRQGANTRGAVLTSDDDGGTRLDLRIASGPDDGPDALDGAPLRGATRTSPLTIDLTCHGYDEGATRAYNCIPEPSQQRYMRTFVPAVGSACDRGSIAEFPAGRTVFQIRCRDGSAGQSGAWSYSGQGPAFFVKPIDTPRVWVRTSFSGSSVHLSVWCRAPQGNLVVNELLGRSWGNDGTNGIYGMAGCREVEVDTGGGEDLQWWFTEELAATALTPPRSWEQATGADRALPAEARQDLATAAELERLWSRPGR